MKKLKRVLLSACLCLALIFLPLTIIANESGLGTKADFGILPYQALSVNSVDSTGQKGDSIVVVPEPTAQDLERGFIEQLGAIELKIISNTIWTLAVSTNNSDMGTSYDGAYVKPIEDFQLRAGTGPYISLSHKNQKLMNGFPGMLIPSIDYRMLVDPEKFHPGSYRIEVIYMLTSL